MYDNPSPSAESIGDRYEPTFMIGMTRCIDVIDEMDELDTETPWQEFYMEIDAWATRSMPVHGFGDV